MARWSGTHCSAALVTTTSETGREGSDRAQSSMVTTRAVTPSTRRARSTISGLESRPSTSAPGHRCASNRVRLPVPQPRSTTVVGLVAPMRDTSSTNGLPRSSA